MECQWGLKHTVARVLAFTHFTLSEAPIPAKHNMSGCPGRLGAYTTAVHWQRPFTGKFKLLRKRFRLIGSAAFLSSHQCSEVPTGVGELEAKRKYYTHQSRLFPKCNRECQPNGASVNQNVFILVSHCHCTGKSKYIPPKQLLVVVPAVQRTA
jgi:hypothetical protein